MNKKRAQAWGYDLMVGVAIFVIGIFAFFLFSLNYNSGEDTKLDELKYEGKILGNSLISEGYPKYWNVTNFTNGQLQQIGILSNGVINKTKLDYFYQIIQLDYKKTKGIFSLKDEYYINFTNSIYIYNGSRNILINGTGVRPDSSAKNVIRVTRLVSNGSEIQTVNIFIWN